MTTALETERVSDEVTRKIEYKITTDQMLQPRWAKRAFNPRYATVTFKNGQFQTLLVEGPNRNKNGTDAKTSGRLWIFSVEDMPAWLRPLVNVTWLEA